LTKITYLNEFKRESHVISRHQLNPSPSIETDLSSFHLHLDQSPYDMIISFGNKIYLNKK